MPNHRKAPRLALALRGFAVLALAGASAPLGGCNDFGDVTGSISGATAPPSDEAKLRAYAEECGRRYERNPGEKTASIEYARALRALTRYNEAVAVIQTAAIKSPKDFDILGEYGKALADAGQLAQAKDVLSRAYTPDDPRWDVMSVQGSVADRLGDHGGNAVLSRSVEDRAQRTERAHQHGAFARPQQAAAGGGKSVEASDRQPEGGRAHARRPRPYSCARRQIRRGSRPTISETDPSSS